jgi:CheY-like chemotaxis protein
MTAPLTSPKRILLVEDDRYISFTLCELFKEENYLVDSAANGAEALELLRGTGPRPDVILLDLMMPVMDGIQFREAQGKDPLISGIPVILMSADGQIDNKKDQVGAACYLKKPLEIDDVLNSLQSVLRS